MTTDTHEPPGPPTETPRRSPALVWLIAGALVLVVGAVVAAIALSNDSSNDGNAAGTQQLTSIRQACAQWNEAYNGSSTPPSAWCDDMVGWMTEQTRSGHMMGSMMWSNPAQMRTTCEQWMSQASGGSSQDPSSWCGEMVGWMTDHLGDWDHWDQGWMMNGSMMGR